MNDAPAREPVLDEFGAALLALLDEERIMVGDGLIERQCWLDAVFVEDGKDAEDPDPVAVFVVAVAADIGELRLVAGPHPLGAAQRAHRQRGAGRDIPVPVLRVDDDGKGDAGVVRPSENGARTYRGPRVAFRLGAGVGFRKKSHAVTSNALASTTGIRVKVCDRVLETGLGSVLVLCSGRLIE
jgi:hypothetical protein